jgi:hypothetical protein
MNDGMMATLKPDARLALYYAPPVASAWWQAGCEWLGRDAQTGEAFDTPTPSALAALGVDAASVTKAPRRYGWHGTLVAPFRCAAGVTPIDVLSAAQHWSQHQKPFDMTMKAEMMGRFVALRAAHAADDETLRSVAASALHALAPLRARSSVEEIERRITPAMCDRQVRLLREWDYPYVLDEFRFHMTVSDSLEHPEMRTAIATSWTDRIATLGALPFSGAALFVEPESGAPFMLWQRLPFARAKDTV